MNPVAFCKMQGLGNDFVVIDTFRQTVSLTPAKIRALADRHLGIGFDQLLLLSPAQNADLTCQIYNADGSEAEQCGNGLRAVALYMHEEKLSSKTTVSIATKAGLFELQLEDFTRIRANMGAPLFGAKLLHQLENSELSLSTVSMGNPHAIHRVAALDLVPVELWGAAIETNPAFPQGVNCGFMEVLSPEHIRLRTYERGSGETLACGSNACAAVVVGIQENWLASKVKVELRHGTLEVEWQKEANPVFLTGPATRVFDGTFS